MIRVKLADLPTSPLTARERTLIRNLRQLPAERQDTVVRYAEYVANRRRGAPLMSFAEWYLSPPHAEH